MVLRKRILLDALKSSTPGALPPAPKFDPPIPASRAEPGGARRERGFLARAFSDRTVQVAFIVFAAGLGVAFWLGRKSAGEVSAAPHGAPDGNAAGALVRPALEKPIVRAPDQLALQNQQTAANGTAHERAFMDKENKYTLRLIQYKNDETGLASARATCDALRNREGLPVVGPIVSGDILLVCAGAEPKVSDLERLRAYVRELRGPNSNKNEKPFADAYVVNIDDVIRR